MCTDGLSNMVEDEEIFQIVRSSRDVVEAVEQLIRKRQIANGRKGQLVGLLSQSRLQVR